MLRRIALLVAAVIAAVIVVGGLRTWRVTSRQPQPLVATPAPPAPVDLAATLAEALQYKTVSYDAAPPDPEEHARVFESFHAFLSSTFPRTLAIGQTERIGGHSLLVSLGAAPVITIDGAPPAAGATSGSGTASGVLLYAHLDVVPATADGWRADPFGGTRDGDTIVGRGAIDDKTSVIAILAAAESLLATGWVPKRPVYLAFGHDEEAGGLQGAAALAGHLRGKGVKLESLLDEGGAVVDKGVPGLGGRPIAAVAIAEKGVLNVEICTAAPPGHASTPPPTTAIGTLATAIRELEDHPPARSLNPLVRNALTYAAAEMSLGYRALVANLWLTSPLIKSQIEKDNVSRALLGTSQAVTMVGGGVKSNVLPERACATVNYRLFPGDTTDAVQQRISRRLREQNGLDVTITAQAAVPPPSPSDLDSPPGKRLSSIIRLVFPTAVVVPVVAPGATDSRHFGGLADQIFRFIPLHLSPDDLASTHGLNERVTVAGVQRAFEFYVSYLREAGR